MGMDFSIGKGEVSEEEGHPYQLFWQNLLRSCCMMERDFTEIVDTV